MVKHRRVSKEVFTLIRGLLHKKFTRVEVQVCDGNRRSAPTPNIKEWTVYSRTRDIMSLAQALRLYSPVESGAEWILAVFCASTPRMRRGREGGHEWVTSRYATFLGTLRLEWGENQAFSLRFGTKRTESSAADL